MRCVVQRVLTAAVTANGTVVGSIGPGLCVLVGIAESDTKIDLEWMANKLVALRIFDSLDGATSWALGVRAKGGDVLLVSQFTLCHTLKGNKPDFHRAMKASTARAAFDDFVQLVGAKHDPKKVQTGAFGEKMVVDIAGDGPVTIILDSPDLSKQGGGLPAVDD